MHSFIFRFHFASRRINNKINYFCYYVIILFRSQSCFITSNGGRALIVQIGACVSGRSVSLLVMCPWFNTFEYFFHRRERALGVYFLQLRTLTVRSYILIPHPDMRNIMAHHARATYSQLFLLGCTITLADAD